MASISISVGPITVTKTAADDRAQEVFEKVYARIGDNMKEHTAKEKLGIILSDVIDRWVSLAGEIDQAAEQDAYMSKLAEIYSARQATRAEWK